MTFAELEMLAAAAKPLNDGDRGSERHTEAQNAFFAAVQDMVSEEVFKGLQNYCLNATPNEIIEAGLQAARGERTFAEYRGSAFRGVH